MVTLIRVFNIIFWSSDKRIPATHGHGLPKEIAAFAVIGDDFLSSKGLAVY